jgi:hypothetical protein
MKKLLILVMALSMGLAGIVSAAPGQFNYRKWDGNPGLQQYQRDLTTAPNRTFLVNSSFQFPNFDNNANTGTTTGLETPTWENGSNYLGRFDGWVVPPVNGDYTFWISSDDSSEFWLSTDDNSANAVRMCYVTGWTGQRNWNDGNGGGEAIQKSVTVALKTAKAYYFYAIWNEGGGGDGVSVGFQCPQAGVTTTTVIPLSVLYDTKPVFYNATNPVPANAVIDVPITTALSWTGIDPALIASPNYRVYFGPNRGEPNLPKVADIKTTSWDPPGDLVYGKKYYWRIDVADVNQTGEKVYKGEEWSFTAYSQGVYIRTQPLKQVLDMGADGLFSFKADALIAGTWTWYKEAGAVDTLLTSGVLTGGGVENIITLSIPGATKANNGYYYCVVSNSVRTQTTVQAPLVIKEQIAYWPFDGDAKDYSGLGNDAALVSTPATQPLPGFTAGVKGQAVQFNGIDQYASAGTLNPSAGSDMITVALWARWEPTTLTAGDQWQGLIGKREGWSATQTYWQIEMSFQNNNRTLPYLNGLAQYDVGTGAKNGYLRNFQGINRAEYGTATASAQNLPNEGAATAFDSNRDTKWLAFVNAPCWIAYDFKDDQAYMISKYAMTSANDAAERDPTEWTLEGSNDGGTTWTVVDTRTGEGFSDRLQTKEFTVATPGVYKMYKLNITKNNGNAAITQLADLQLFEVVDLSQKWVHVVATFDDTMAKLYLNGLEAVSSPSGFRFGAMPTALFGIGTCEVRADGTYGNRFMGSIDEVHVFNYALDKWAIAQMYANEGGKSVCPELPQYDFNGNCVVDLADLMTILSEWTMCNAVGPDACK